MSNYTPLKTYKVCQLISKTEYPSTFTSFEDTAPHTEPFATYDEAEDWINTNGIRQVAYTIIEVFRKP